MAYSSKFEGKQVDKAVETVLDEKVVVHYGNLKGNLSNQEDLALVLNGKLPTDHVTDDSTLPDSAEEDATPTVPTSKAVRTYVQHKTASFLDRDLSNLSPEGKANLNYKAGVGIKIDEVTKTISNETPAYWGSITGALSNQTDLMLAFGYFYKENDSIKGSLDSKINKTAGVSRREGNSVGNVSTPIYVDASGMAKVCERPIPVSTSEIAKDSTKVLTSGGAYTNLVSREPNTAVGSPTTPVYVTETGRVAACTSIDTVSTVADIKEKGNQPVSAAGVMNVLETLYPVGAVYLGVTASCPLASLFGTWEKIAADRVLQGSSASYAAGTMIEAGLPNIKGRMGNTDGSSASANGCFYRSGTSGKLENANGEPDPTIYFDASRSNSIYGKSTTVQPPAYVVNVWRRVS